MDEADWIIFAYPCEEPDWSLVQLSSLIKLVQEYDREPSCAGLALYELGERQYPQFESLCEWLLRSSADKWLRTSALAHLLSVNPMHGLNVALEIIDLCEYELLEEIVMSLNYEHQGDLSVAVHQHPIIPKVKNRLAKLGSQMEYGAIFRRYYGT